MQALDSDPKAAIAAALSQATFTHKRFVVAISGCRGPKSGRGRPSGR